MHNNSNQQLNNKMKQIDQVKKNTVINIKVVQMILKNFNYKCFNNNYKCSKCNINNPK